MWRNLRVDVAKDDPVSLQLAKVLGQHLLRHLGDQPTERVEALRPRVDMEEDGGLPLSGDDRDRLVDRTSLFRCLCSIVFHTKAPKAAYLRVI